jgi:hypothetical protein
MARRATIIGTIKDIHGQLFDVRESRPTKHGFDILLGWPTVRPRGQGMGGQQVIATEPLVEYLEKMRLSPGDIDLPVGQGAVKRLRALLKHNWREDNAAWWADNPEGPNKSHAARHNWRKKFGIQSNMWTPEMDDKLLKMYAAGASVKDMAAAFGKSSSAIWARKWKLGRHE